MGPVATVDDVSATPTRLDLARLLDLVYAVHEAPASEFLRTMLAGTATLVRSDTVSYNEQDTAGATEQRFVIEPEYTSRIRVDAGYLAHLGEHPAFEAVAQGRLAVGEAVSISDLISPKVFRSLPIYREYYRHREVVDQLVVLIGARHSRIRLLVLSRSRPGFGARDRAATGLLVPHLRQAIRHRERVARLAATVSARPEPVPLSGVGWDRLTPRELDVLGQIRGTGASDRQIGRVLRISERTVGKHLENVYRKLGLTGRAALVAALSGVPANH